MHLADLTACYRILVQVADDGGDASHLYRDHDLLGHPYAGPYFLLEPALCFVLTLEDPQRFAKSRSVGAYLGLRSRQRDSGEQRPQLRITKAGDALLRRLLVTAAHYILGPFGPDTELRRFGLRLAERGGKAAKKRAVVAVARRLAVLLHRLWITGEACQPLDYDGSLAQAA